MKWRWPYLDLWLDIGLLSVSTALWRERYETCTKDYVLVSVKVLGRWGFRFRLYSPDLSFR
jgi:hypothetical protein